MRLSTRTRTRVRSRRADCGDLSLFATLPRRAALSPITRRTADCAVVNSDPGKHLTRSRCKDAERISGIPTSPHFQQGLVLWFLAPWPLGNLTGSRWRSRPAHAVTPTANASSAFAPITHLAHRCVLGALHVLTMMTPLASSLPLAFTAVCCTLEGLNNKIRVVIRRSYGFRTYRAMEVALFSPTRSSKK
jgi:hypothetical protein